MIWACDALGAVTYVGPEWEVFTGQTEANARGQGWLDVLHDDDRDATYALFMSAVANRAPFTIKYRLRYLDGSFRRIVSGAVPSVAPIQLNFIGYLGSASDVEDRPDIWELATEGFLIAPPSDRTKPLTVVDAVADNLLIARALAANAGETRLLPSLDFALSEVFRRIGTPSPGLRH